jgi:serine/threonine protein kinase
MTTRDPRSRVPLRPDTGREGAREPTASLSLEIEKSDLPDSHIEHPSLAVGTSEAAREHQTKIESPIARNKTPVPKPPTKPPPVPARSGVDDYPIGTVLGAYKLVELLGKGGMGYVFRAEHVKLGREVALKLLRGDYAKRRDAVLRFFQEAKTVNRVRHRNIVDVTDFVELPDGTTFIIMELLRGQSLGKWARTGVDLPRALAVLVQICDGLGAAHAVGVVHRDLKPDNVIVVPTSDGAELVKLLDFGVAKLVNREDHDDDLGFQTAAGSVIGTPAYMSPEQAGGMAVDHRSDIYSLGAIMYELFCGQPMFRGRSFGEYVRKHLTEAPVLPHMTPGGANIDPNLEALILKSLAKDPEHRFSNILELRDGLLALLGGIETHPPGYASLSAIRTGPPTPAAQMPTMAAAPMLPPHMLPSPGPHMATTQPSMVYPPHVSGQHLQFSGFTTPTPVPAEPATPWWVWAAGATLAVGLGIGGALWYARSTNTPAPVEAKPAQIETAPIEKPAPKLVELKFDSLPSGGVYADGRSAELCRTPCNFNVDLGDGGPTDRRTFVVRADGYKDKPVVVDFASEQRAYSATLERIIPTVPTVPTVTETQPVDMEDEATDETDEPVDPKKPASKKSRKTHKTSEKTPETKPEETKPVEVVPEQVKPPEKKPDDTNLEPIDKKKPRPIDPADTIDPFRKK